MKLLICSLLTSALISTSSSAAILNADSTNLVKVFATAKDGDTIKASGTFGPLALLNRSFTTNVTLDATNAAFTDSVTIRNVNGLNVLNGTFGSKTAYMRTFYSLVVDRSSNINLLANSFIGTGTTALRNADPGLYISNSKLIDVSSANFTQLLTGIAISSSTDVNLTNNNFTSMTRDGINIANSHRVNATANMCSGTVPFLGAHPDCIQLWSVLGQPVQSDIKLLRNVALGATQGFTSFAPNDGGGLRISMIGNTVSTSYPQGIACYNCVDSIFTDNVLLTLPGAQFRTSLNIIGGSNNYLANNTIGLQYQAQSRFSADVDTLTMDDSLADLSANDFTDDASYGLAAIPEPSEWFMLTIGFGIVGGFARRSRHTSQRCRT